MEFGIEEKRKNWDYRENFEIGFSFKRIKRELEEADIDTNYTIFRFREQDDERRKLLYDYVMEKYDVIEYMEEFENKIVYFFDILFSEKYPYRYTKILLELAYPSDIIDCCYRAIVNLIYAYDNLDLYDDESGLLQVIISSTDSVYKNLSVGEIDNQLRKYGYGKNCDKFKFPYECYLIPSFLNDDAYTGVEERESKVKEDINFMDTFDRDDFFTYAEYKTYLIEKAYLKMFGLENRVRWVARYDGDMQHYDILSYDPENDKEKIIEVKSTIMGCSTFSLTPYEMYTFKESEDAIRYVFWYRISNYLDKENTILMNKGKRREVYILEYVSDEENGYFIDHNGNCYNICIRYNENGEIRYEVFDTNEKVAERGKIISKKYAEMISFK